MTPYERYLELHPWRRGRPLGERRFHELAGEYLAIDRGATVGELTDDEWDRFDELKDMLGAELTIG
jgi:hypothetical protein